MLLGPMISAAARTHGRRFLVDEPEQLVDGEVNQAIPLVAVPYAVLGFAALQAHGLASACRSNPRRCTQRERSSCTLFLDHTQATATHTHACWITCLVSPCFLCHTELCLQQGPNQKFWWPGWVLLPRHTFRFECARAYHEWHTGSSEYESWCTSKDSQAKYTPARLWTGSHADWVVLKQLLHVSYKHCLPYWT